MASRNSETSFHRKEGLCFTELFLVQYDFEQISENLVGAGSIFPHASENGQAALQYSSCKPKGVLHQ